MPGREQPPLVTRVDLALAMRDPEGEETPVIVLVLGFDGQDQPDLTVHMTEHTGMDFGPDLLVAVRQLAHGRMRMPY